MNLRSIILLLLLLPGLAGLSTATAQQNGVLQVDLNQALEIALSENPTVKVADMEITKKEYARKSAYGALLPQIDLIGQYQRAIKRQTVYFDMDLGALTGGDTDDTGSSNNSGDGFQMGRFNSWTAGVNVSLPIVVPSLWKNIQMSEVDIRLSIEQGRASRIDLMNQVKKSFFSLLLAQDSHDVLQKTYETDSVNLGDIRNRYNQGIVAEYDVITADVRLKSLIPNILQSENMMRIAELQLKVLMGIDGDIPLKVTGSLNDYEKTMFDAIIPADTSLVHNSDIKQFDLQAEKAQKAYELQKLQFAPTLTSTFSWLYMSQNNNFKISTYRWDPYSTLGVSLQIPLFSGGQRYHNVKQSEIQLWQLNEQRKDVERGLKLSVRNNYDLIHKNIEQIVATKSSIELARKGHEITLKRYETGMGTIVDVNAAALAVLNAELQYRNAIYDYLAAKADLEKVLGYDISPVDIR